MRTPEEIKEYLMLNDRFPEKEKALIENALIVEKLYAKEIENGEYEYALVSDFINSPFILEDEDEVDKLVEIEQIGGIVVYKPIFSDSNEQFWKCTLFFSAKSSEGYYEEIESEPTSQGYDSYIFKHDDYDEYQVYIDLKNMTIVEPDGFESQYDYFTGTFQSLEEAKIFIETFKINEDVIKEGV